MIEQVTRLAKRIVLVLDTGDRIAIEPRMTGLMLLADPPSRDHLRLEWILNDGQTDTSLWFWDRRGLGTVTVFSPEEYETRLLSGKLGPDALEMTFGDWAALRARTKRAVKVALLDQKLVAGIGNLYASEILHRVGICPQRSAASLSDRELRQIDRAARYILNRAIRYEGSTLGDGTYRNALNQDGGYQNEHRVYDREGEPCRKCRGPIVRIVQSQRSTFYCPVCQPND